MFFLCNPVHTFSLKQSAEAGDRDTNFKDKILDLFDTSETKINKYKIVTTCGRDILLVEDDGDDDVDAEYKQGRCTSGALVTVDGGDDVRQISAVVCCRRGD